ncbi:MAG TPA: hypothetical protein VGM11_02580, partial [Acidobacteriaceae bacterium]
MMQHGGGGARLTTEAPGSPGRGELCVMGATTIRASLKLVLTLALVAPGAAQTVQNTPPTDTSAQASPLRPPPKAAATDASQLASPAPAIGERGHAVWVAPHTAIDVKLRRSIDSGRLKNGETVPATLEKPIALSPKGMLNAGTLVELTVVETLPAGRIYAAGEFSLQVLRVGSLTVYTNTLTYRGKPGHKDLPDSAPAVGTDAGLAAGTELTFHVLPPPEAVDGPPKGSNGGP